MFMFVKKANISVTVCSMGHSNMIKYLSHRRKLQFCVEVFLHFWPLTLSLFIITLAKLYYGALKLNSPHLL